MKTPKLLHIFKPGKHRTSAGELIEFSDADLQASARAYNPSVHKAPLVIGHPRTDDPAQGWAKTLMCSQSGLYVEPTKVDPAFAESVNAGRFGTISAKFYRPTDASNPVPGVWYLRHIGFLGAQAPAIKGLEEPEFAEEDGVTFDEGVEFRDWTLTTQASLWRRMREFLIAKFGIEEAESIVPDIEISFLDESARRAESESELETQVAFNENPINKPTTYDIKESSVDDKQATALTEENASLKQRIAALELSIANEQANKRHADNVAFSESLVQSGQLLPKNADVVVATLDALNVDEPVEFGEGYSKQPLFEAFKSFLTAQPKQVEFGERATKGAVSSIATAVEFSESESDRMAVHQKAEALAKEQNISYEQAVRTVITK